MICKNCGGEFDERQLLCPYCGAENEEEAKKRQADTINEINEKTKEMLQKPEKVVKKAANYIYIIAGGVVLLFVIMVIVVWGFSKVSAASALDRQNKKVEELEQLYQEGKYGEMGNCLDTIDNSYAATFKKYDTISHLYTTMTYQIDYCESDLYFASTGNLEVQRVMEDLEEIFGSLYSMKQLEEAGFVYGEKEGVLYVRGQLETTLKETMQLTDEEIRLGIDMMADENSDYMELAEISLERMEAVTE